MSNEIDLEAALQYSNPLGTLKGMKVEGFTVFENEDFKFCDGINIIVGENGSGKSHLMKLAYAASKALYPVQVSKPIPGKEALGRNIAEKLIGVFLPDGLGRLCRRGRGRQRSEISLEFVPPENFDYCELNTSLSFSFSTNSSSNVVVESFPTLPTSPEGGPIFLSAREMISLSPDFSRDYKLFSTRFDETYYDLSLALVGGVRPGRRSGGVDSLVAPLEDALEGTLYVQKGSGHIYLKRSGRESFEMPLLSEGERKLAMLAFLILNGTLSRHGTLYWDEPETNLNPLLMIGVVKVLVRLAASGVQIFIATHSLFLMRQMALQLEKGGVKGNISARYFSLTRAGAGVVKEESDNIDGLDNIHSLNAAIAQDEAFEARYWSEGND